MAAFAAMVIGIVGLYFKGALFPTHPAAIAFQAAMFALMVWSRIVLGRHSSRASAAPAAAGLLTTGPYAYLRHPIYAAIIHFIWAGALSELSWSVLGFAETVTAGAFTQMHVEEYQLKRRYPEYAAYKRRAKKLIPFVY